MTGHLLTGFMVAPARVQRSARPDRERKPHLQVYLAVVVVKHTV